MSMDYCLPGTELINTTTKIICMVKNKSYPCEPNDVRYHCATYILEELHSSIEFEYGSNIIILVPIILVTICIASKSTVLPGLKADKLFLYIGYLGSIASFSKFISYPDITNFIGIFIIDLVINLIMIPICILLAYKNKFLKRLLCLMINIVLVNLISYLILEKECFSKISYRYGEIIDGDFYLKYIIQVQNNIYNRNVKLDNHTFGDQYIFDIEVNLYMTEQVFLCSENKYYSSLKKMVFNIILILNIIHLILILLVFTLVLINIKKNRINNKTPVNSLNIITTEECVICMEATPQVTYSCGHKIVCNECYQKNINNGGNNYCLWCNNPENIII